MSLSGKRIEELALEHLQTQRQQVQAEIDELRAMIRNLEGTSESQDNRKRSVAARRGRPRGQMSEAQKQAISKTMKQRWAERRTKSIRQTRDNIVTRGIDI